MKEFKGTPGPWIYAANSSFFEVGQDHRKEQLGSIIPVYPSACIGVSFDQEDDARLIAAAPELLEALMELRDLVQDYLRGLYRPDSFTLQPADHAIAKALGETE